MVLGWGAVYRDTRDTRILGAADRGRAGRAARVYSKSITTWVDVDTDSFGLSNSLILDQSEPILLHILHYSYSLSHPYGAASPCPAPQRHPTPTMSIAAAAGAAGMARPAPPPPRHASVNTASLAAKCMLKITFSFALPRLRCADGRVGWGDITPRAHMSGAM